MLAINTFPDEIIIQILAQPAIDLRTLGAIMTVSSKLRRLVLHVLMVYRLPTLLLALTVEQEGKSRITTNYRFSYFCPTSLTILLTADKPKTRRYYTSKACPVVRSMAIKDASDSSSDSLCAIPSIYYPQSLKKLSAQKEGHHVLQASSWKLAYNITNIQKPEYYLTPVSVAVEFGHLITVESVNRPVDHPSRNYSLFVKLNKVKRCATDLFSM
ncbi:hypothetical protein PS15m_010609 [Mucor circinelloides]